MLPIIQFLVAERVEVKATVPLDFAGQSRTKKDPDFIVLSQGR
jgi:hypothetical protein